MTDAVYNNDLDLVRQYLQSKEVKKYLGKKNTNSGISHLFTVYLM